MLEAARVPFEKCVEHCFCIAMTVKGVTARFERFADFKVVIDFAVEDDNSIAIGRKNRLIPAGQDQ